MRHVIEFEMPIPSKKNNKRARGNKVVSSHEFYDYQSMMVEIIDWRDDPIDEPVFIAIDILVGDKRRRDPDNMETSILDILREASVLADDTLFHIPKCFKQSRYEKGEWGCQVTICSASAWRDEMRKLL